jgi:beta-glucanase (GH16 family)
MPIRIHCISFMLILTGLQAAPDQTTVKVNPSSHLTFKTQKGVYYQLEQKQAPTTNWTSVGPPVSGTGKDIEQHLKAAPDGNASKYRLRKLIKQWVMVWRDEFNGQRLDPAKWAREENGYGGGNNERQFYSTDEKYSQIKNGKLNISVYRDPYTTVDGKTQPYTSARIRTLHRAQWKYGRFEIRAKMPHGQGIWPAVWMLPSQSPYGGWASSGEIDIIESRGSEVAKTTGALHFGGEWPRNTYLAGEYSFPDKNSAQEFHTYTLEWNKDQISWAVDGITYQTIKKEQWHSEKADNKSSAPFDQAFHLIINVAVDGRFFNATKQNSSQLPDSAFPQTLEVDYIRVYQWAE